MFTTHGNKGRGLPRKCFWARTLPPLNKGYTNDTKYNNSELT